MERVLLVLKDLRIGNGIASAISSYYDSIINEGFDVDFLLLQAVDSPFMEKAREHGNVYILPASKFKYSPERNQFLKHIFEQQKYSIVHVNLPGPYGAMILKAAQKAGVENRIYHAHNPKNNLTVKSRISSSVFNRLCSSRGNYFLSCSESAGRSFFEGKEFRVLKNRIDTEKFTYSDEARRRERKQLGIDETTCVIGAVGRLEAQKNVKFAIDCFEEFLKLKPDSVFVWIGEGSQRKKIQSYIEKKGLCSKVLLLGVQPNIAEWYSFMDVFLLPSRFEGLGIVFIEAQASGLACFGSTNVPKDTEVTGLMYRLNVNDGASKWAVEMSNVCMPPDRKKYVREVIEAGFDTKTGTDMLARIYKSLVANDNGVK